MNIGSKQTQETKETTSKTQAVPSFLLKGSTSKPSEQVPNSQVEQSKQKSEQIEEGKDEILDEFQVALRELNEMKAAQNQSGCLFLKLEEFTQNVKFQRHETIKQDLNYVKHWLEYAGQVQDTDQIYEFMIEREIGKQNLNLYISLALYYEKYKRNFQKSEELYRKALEIFPNETQKNSILNKFKEFSQRMEMRCERDVVSNIGQEEFKKLTNSKKRKRDEAFPELNESNDSSNSSKMRRLNCQQQVEQYSKSIEDYTDGILYLKKSRANFQEIEVHEDLVREQNQKPFSWIARQQNSKVFDLRQPNTMLSEQSSLFATLRMDLNSQAIIASKVSQQHQQPEAQEESKVDEFNNNCDNRQQKLDPIGEISLEIGSSIANLTLYQKDVKEEQSQSKGIQRQESQESKGFLTANNSNNQSVIVMNRTIQNSTQSKPREDIQGRNEVVMQMIQEIQKKYYNDDNKENRDSRIGSIVLDVFKGFQQVYGIQDDHSFKISQENQSTQAVFTNLPALTQPTFTPQCQQEINRASLKPEPFDQKPKDRSQKRFSGILMQLIENDEKSKQDQPTSQQPFQTNYRSIPPQFLQDSSFQGNNQRTSQQLPLQPPQKDWMNMNIFPLNNGPSNRYSGNNNYINMSGSFLDATPVNDKFERNINPNYSRDYFQKKKTVSKNKEVFDVCYQDEREIFQSPFGPVSPLPNQESKARNSNIMRDHNSEFFNVLTKGNIQPNFNQIVSAANHQQNSQYYQTNTNQQNNNNWYNNMQQQNYGYNQQQQQYSANNDYNSNYRNNYQYQQPQQQQQPNYLSNANNIFTGSTGNTYPQYTNQKPNQPNQALNFSCIQSNPNNYRDSVDSQGQEFKDCNSHENIAYSSFNNQATNQQSNSRGLPSALKSNHDENSRNGSKSVRFK